MHSAPYGVEQEALWSNVWVITHHKYQIISVLKLKSAPVVTVNFKQRWKDVASDIKKTLILC